MSWSEIAITAVSWLFYAGAILGLVLSVGLIAFTGKEALNFSTAISRIGVGFAILCLGGGL
ncbi:MAG: hypothetical protein R3C16_12500 [Hyphomonadaceae bacterium]